MLMYGNKLKTPWHGVDVSDHQGIIDWDRLIEEQEIDFAIIRTTWGTEGIDKQYKRNVEACARLGIPFGLYHYSYIGDSIEKYTGEERKQLLYEQAISEAKHFLEAIEPYEYYLDLPVFMDIEDSNQGKYLGQLSKEELNFVVRTFCEYVARCNYLVGIYASKYWLENKLNYMDLPNGIDDVRGVFDVWVAEWTGSNDGQQHTEESNYKDIHFIWQYTSKKFTECTTSTKYLDCNVCYLDYFKVLESSGLNGRWADGFEDIIKNAPINRWIKIEKGNYTTKYLIGEEPFWMFKKSNGGIAKGWVASGSKWYFTRPDVGVMVKGIHKIDNDMYYFTWDNGDMASNCWLDTPDGLRYARPNGKFAKNIIGEPFLKWKINGEDITFDPIGNIYFDDNILSQCTYAPECLGKNGTVIDLICDPTPIKTDKPQIVEPEPTPEPEPEEPQEPEKIYFCKVYEVCGDNHEKKLIESKFFIKGDKLSFEFKSEDNKKIKYVEIFSYDENKELFVKVDTKDVVINDMIKVENNLAPSTDIEIVAYYEPMETPVEPDEPIVPDKPNQSNKWVVALVTAILAGIVWLISLFM